ncbi:MAG TPA: ABC transporter substrate-binding protein [Candidatus Bathyarchaeia archaeon]|nr:ABC transporter substrate-binding protein [Candidatus Bathyarchaeia archaeon]
MSDTSKIRIGYLSTMYHTSILIKSLEWLEKKGIKTRWTLFGTGPAIVDALTRDELDVGYIGLAPTIIGIGKGAKIKCIAGGHVEGTIILGKGEYKPILTNSNDWRPALEQFKGKKLGTPRRGSLHDVFLRFYLTQFGLSESVEVVNYEWADFIPDALRNDEIAGAAGTPPLAVISSILANAKIIVPPNLIWPNNPSYGIVTSVDNLTRRSDLLEKFLVLHKNACRLLRERPEEAATHIAKAVGIIDKDFALKALEISPKYCAALSTEFVGSTMRLVPVLRDLKYLSSDPKESEIFEHQLIDKIHPEPPHYT